MLDNSIKILKFFPPELAHSITINALKYLKFNFDKIDDPLLSQHLMGLDFPNPIGLAAGFDKNAEVVRAMFSLGFGFVEVGTVTPLSQRGNLKPRIFRLEKDNAIINSLGFNNKGSKKIKKNLQKFKNSISGNRIIGINLGKNKNSLNSIDDYLLGMDQLASLSSYITINISSPNTKGLRDLQLRGNIENLIKKIMLKKEKIEIINKKPVFIKISPDLNDNQLRDIALISLANNIDGLILTNTTTNRPSYLLSKNKINSGGLSGKPLFERSNTILRKMYSLTNGQIVLVGVGGIFSGSDCYEKIKSGASLVQLYTALTFAGPLLISKIKNELVDLIKTDGYKNIGDVIGKSV